MSLTNNSSGWIENKRHFFPIRVYYADTDCSGVVYHARYLEFLERARTEFLRLYGISHSILAQGHGSVAGYTLQESLSFVVRAMQITFKQPACIDEALVVESQLLKIAGARLFMQQSLKNSKKEKPQLLLEAGLELALINKKGHPRRVPLPWAATLFGI